MATDYQAQFGPVEQRQRYIKARIMDASRASDHDEVENWQNQLKELEAQK